MIGSVNFAAVSPAKSAFHQLSIGINTPLYFGIGWKVGRSGSDTASNFLKNRNVHISFWTSNRAGNQLELLTRFAQETPLRRQDEFGGKLNQTGRNKRSTAGGAGVDSV